MHRPAKSPNTWHVHAVRGVHTGLCLPRATYMVRNYALLVNTHVWAPNRNAMRVRSHLDQEGDVLYCGSQAQSSVVHGGLHDVCNECSPANLDLMGTTDRAHMETLCRKGNNVGSGAAKQCQLPGVELKSMWRTGRGCTGWIHMPKACTHGKEMYANPNHLRGNHYYLRTPCKQSGIRVSKRRKQS